MKDTSGNSNNWTPNNLSVTAGAGNDSLVDSPTNYGTDTGVGGEVRGNYCTLNPLSSTGTLSNGNLDSSTSSKTNYGTIAFPSSGKWYFEISNVTGSTNVGIAAYAVGATTVYTISNSCLYSAAGVKNVDGVLDVPFGAQYGSGYGGGSASDVIGIAADSGAGTVAFYKNNTLQGTITHTVSGLFPVIGDGSSASSATLNFGQRAFAYTAPSGFKALCTQNLPEGTITTSGTYTGNGVADGPFVYLNGVPTAMTVGGNAVTFGTHADKLSNGFKLRTTSTTYNQNALSYSYSITTTGAKFKYARAQPNP